MQGGDCFVPRAIGYDTINGWLAIQKKYTNRQSLLDLESQRAPVRSVDGARLDNYTPGFPAHQLRLAKNDWMLSTMTGIFNRPFTRICGSLKYSQHQSKKWLFNGKMSRMPTPVPRPRITLLPAESLENVLSAGLWGTALRPLVPCVALRRARKRSISSSISASITSEGKKSVETCERSSVEFRADAVGEVGALFDDVRTCGDEGRE